jgi:hypothetical protein
MEATDDLDCFSPAYLMTSAEFRTAKSLLRQIAGRREKRRVLYETKPKNYGAQESNLTTEIEVLDTRLNALCEEVLKRTIGLEKYMVVRVERDGGLKANMQVLECGLMDGFRHHGYAWHIEGVATRKDGTIGKKWDYFIFDFAKIERRKLDGTWQRLKWTEAENEPAAK